MEYHTAPSEAAASGSTQGLLAGVVVALAAILLPHLWFSRDQSGSFKIWSFAFPLLLATGSFVWLGLVSAFVPEPYLDEVFHIPQAQKYCEGRLREWDDKITTPPGLYLLTIWVPRLAKASGLTDTVVCDAQTLRSVNVIGLVVLSYLAFLCRHQIEARLHEQHLLEDEYSDLAKAGVYRESTAQSSTKLGIYSQYALHTAFNIGLFPLLFFFSGLYYTDVLSTAVVIAAYLNHLSRVSRERNSILSDVLTVGLGLFALFMRQTNIFWVVVYMGGLEAVQAVKTLRPKRVDQPFMTGLFQQLTWYAWRYSLGEVHDVPLHDTWPEDMLFTVISLLVAAICNPLRVLRSIWPHMAVLAAFSAFVFWNGGVVLGDKSNHVATIHLAQMLYIWPLFAFFSLPLLLPYAVPVLSRLGGKLLEKPRTSTFSSSVSTPAITPLVPAAAPSAPVDELLSSTSSSKKRGSAQRGRKRAERQSSDNTYSVRKSQLSWTLSWAHTLFNYHPLVWLGYLLATVLLSLAIVKFNTIIHPFTLADNRHYMFYVFRYTLRRAAWIRYFLVLPYTLSRWMVWGAMAGCSVWLIFLHTDMCSAHYYRGRDTPFRNHPFWIDLTDIKRQPRGDRLDSISSDSPEEIVRKKALMEQKYASDPLAYSAEGVSTSTGIVFLLATTLSLITAPLVEPRYFIIPWVMWRLLVPAWRVHDHGDVCRIRPGTGYPYLDTVINVFQRYDIRLILETVWFVVINVVTGYIFLYKPYQWRAEDGMILDGGRLQRFMW